MSLTTTFREIICAQLKISAGTLYRCLEHFKNGSIVAYLYSSEKEFSYSHYLTPKEKIEELIEKAKDDSIATFPPIVQDSIFDLPDEEYQKEFARRLAYSQTEKGKQEAAEQEEMFEQVYRVFRKEDSEKELGQKALDMLEKLDIMHQNGKLRILGEWNNFETRAILSLEEAKKLLDAPLDIKEEPAQNTPPQTELKEIEHSELTSPSPPTLEATDATQATATPPATATSEPTAKEETSEHTKETALTMARGLLAEAERLSDRWQALWVGVKMLEGDGLDTHVKVYKDECGLEKTRSFFETKRTEFHELMKQHGFNTKQYTRQRGRPGKKLTK